MKFTEATALNSRLIEVSFAGNLDAVQELLASGAKVNFLSRDGWTALKIADEHGETEIVRLLRAAGNG